MSQVGVELRYRLTTDGRTGKVCAARIALLEPGTILRELVLSGR